MSQAVRSQRRKEGKMDPVWKRVWLLIAIEIVAFLIAFVWVMS